MCLVDLFCLGIIFTTENEHLHSVFMFHYLTQTKSCIFFYFMVSDRLKDFLHTLQVYGWCPIWLRRCNFKWLVWM